jgi:poly-gamma-glutamate synthesis protein (capsule biosynthesis protein)
MAGERFGYSGYPTFNTPQTLAKTIVDTGFDIVNLANNHAMDMGEAGLLATLDLLDSFPDITVIGARKSGDRHKIITKNNITLGFLAYTYDLNGFALPRNNPSLVSLINRRIMIEDINTLRPLCDFLIVSIHWGEEYQREPGRAQTNLAAFLAEHNVDLIIGHHPHVLQRFEILPRPDGKETFCFYSLGNFVSNQREKDRILGAFMLVTFVKEEAELNSSKLHSSEYNSMELHSKELNPGKLFITNPGLLPIVCHFDRHYNNTKVYPLYLYNEELLENHWCRNVDKSFTMDFLYTSMKGLGVKVLMHNPL